MLNIQSNNAIIKDTVKVNFLGVAILIQDFLFKYHNKEISGKYYKSPLFEYSKYYRTNCLGITKFTDFGDKRDYVLNYYGTLKPIYHCYLILDVGNLISKPIVLWSMEYKTESLVSEMIEMCDNTFKALMKKRKDSKRTSIMSEVMADFKIKYGCDTIPLKVIDWEFAIKKELPGLTFFDSHKNKRCYI